MARTLKGIAVVLLVLGIIGAIMIANIGREFSFTLFLISACVDLIYFLLMYGIGSIWEAQENVASEHFEILALLRKNDSSHNANIEKRIAQIESRQLEILSMLSQEKTAEPEENNQTTEEATQVQVVEEVRAACIVDRTYEDIKRRKAHEGWKCKKCGKNNISSRRTCIECGEPK